MPKNPGEMTDQRRIDPSRVAGAMLVEHCDVPDGMTLCEWRRETARQAAERAAAERAVRRGVLRRVLRRAA